MAKSCADIRANVRATLRCVKGPPPPDNAAEVNALLDLCCGGTINVSNVQRVSIQKTATRTARVSSTIAAGAAQGVRTALRSSRRTSWCPSRGTFLDLGHVIDGEVMNTLWTTWA